MVSISRYNLTVSAARRPFYNTYTLPACLPDLLYRVMLLLHTFTDEQVKQVATQAELEQVLADSEDALVVVDFTATWCTPCQGIAPEFEKLSEELTDVVLLKVDVDENEVSFFSFFSSFRFV